MEAKTNTAYMEAIAAAGDRDRIAPRDDVDGFQYIQKNIQKKSSVFYWGWGKSIYKLS